MDATKRGVATSVKCFFRPLRLRGPIAIFSFFLCLSLLKYLWIAGYAHPVADDFCYAAKSRGASLWAWSYSEWLHWNGRYASNLLMIHGPLTWCPNFLSGYRAIPIVLIALTFFSGLLFLRRNMRHAFTTGQEAIGALVFLVLYMNLMPDIGEGYYWYTGAVTYQLGSILLLAHLAVLCGEPRKGWMGTLLRALNVVLAIVIVGMDEVHMLLMVGLHVGRVAWMFRKRGTQLRSGLLVLTTVCAGATLMFLAPGNAVRGALFANTHQLLPSLGLSILQTARFLGIWALSPALLALSVLYVPVHRLLKERVSGFSGLLQISPWLAGALPVMLVMACTFPAYWSTGLLGQHRTLNVACFFFIPLWFLNLSIWLQRNPLRNWARMKLPPKTVGITMLLALAALNLTHNGFATYVDLFSGRAANYDRVMLQREAEVRAAAQDPSATVTFTQLGKAPLTLPNYEEHGPLRSWMLDCEARYFGAEEQQVGMEGN